MRKLIVENDSVELWLCLALKTCNLRMANLIPEVCCQQKNLRISLANSSFQTSLNDQTQASKQGAHGSTSAGAVSSPLGPAEVCNWPSPREQCHLRRLLPRARSWWISPTTPRMYYEISLPPGITAAGSGNSWNLLSGMAPCVSNDVVERYRPRGTWA